MTVDLWQQQATGPQARVLSWRPSPGARSILVAHEDGSALPALDVMVTWTDSRWLWYPVAALVLGLAMIIGGFVLLGTLSFGALRGRAARGRSALTSRGPTRARSERISRTPSRASTPDADEGGVVSGQAPEVPVQRVRVPPEEPVAALTPAAEGVDQSQQDSDVLPARRTTRGRRRKETVWQRARAKGRPREGGSR